MKWTKCNILSISQAAQLNLIRDFPGGAVVKNQPANAGWIPGPGKSHMPWSN